jgi:2-keto-4-pentenoate hydratase/2-oxohepta-3-ene-1,7-dioic acid hydratase in catechol pathway
MKIFAYLQGDRRRIGVLDGSVLRDLSAAMEAAGVVDSEHDLLRNDFYRPQRLAAFLKRFRRFATKIEGAVVYGPPVIPGKILAIGRNFAEHARELGNPVEDEMIFFAKLPNTVTAHGEPIVIPRHCTRADHEAELAIVMARDGKNIPAQKAFSYVAGYTCLNDVTARDEQGADKARKRPWTRSKNYDSFCPIGPWFVPMDDIVDPYHLSIVCRVNGETRQSGSTQHWIHDIPAMIAYISRHTTLRAGDILATGTPAGVSTLKPGDVVEVEIDQIGVLKNPVVLEAAPAVFDKSTALASLEARLREAVATARDGGEAFERAVALLDELPHFHWTGVYRVEPDGSLGLGPFRGRATAHRRIEPGRGLCGRAIALDRTVVVDDVTVDPEYLACSIETRSEIVVPVRAHGKPVAEIDIDSDRQGAFDAQDRQFLERVSNMLGDFLETSQLPRMWDER